MKYLINESTIKEVAVEWMNRNYNFDKLKKVRNDFYPLSIFYMKNGKVVIEKDYKNKYLLFDYDEIWSFYETFFGMNFSQIRDILGIWMNQDPNLQDFKPTKQFRNFLPYIEKFY